MLIIQINKCVACSHYIVNTRKNEKILFRYLKTLQQLHGLLANE